MTRLTRTYEVSHIVFSFAVFVYAQQYMATVSRRSRLKQLQIGRAEGVGTLGILSPRVASRRSRCALISTSFLTDLCEFSNERASSPTIVSIRSKIVDLKLSSSRLLEVAS